MLQFSDNPTPLEAFNGIAGFEDFLNEIVIPQTLLYSQQQAHLLSNDVDESFVWVAHRFGLPSIAMFERLLKQ